MTKKICLIGSTGYIGKNIKKALKINKNFEVYKYSSKKNEFIDKCNINKFDYLIIAAGIHPSEKDDSPKIFIQNKIIIRNILKLINMSKNILLISSFKTSFNLDKNFTRETNKYNFYNYDSYYGKSKILFEKIFIKIFKKLDKNFLILSPSHVIGPIDQKGSLNNLFLKKILDSKLIFYPKCFISIVDVRNIANLIYEYILNDKFFCQKIILNDISLEMREYISIIKKGQLYFAFMIPTKIINLLYKIQFYLNFIMKFKIKFISYSRINYLNLNPRTIVNKYPRKHNYIDTINDTKKINFTFLF